MKLKRIRNEKSGKQAGERDRKTEAFISRQAPGMCFDFHPEVSLLHLGCQIEVYVEELCPQWMDGWMTVGAHTSPHLCILSYLLV